VAYTEDGDLSIEVIADVGFTISHNRDWSEKFQNSLIERTLKAAFLALDLRYCPVTIAHMHVIFHVVPLIFAIVVHAKLKPWSTTTSGLNPRVV